MLMDQHRGGFEMNDVGPVEMGLSALPSMKMVPENGRTADGTDRAGKRHEMQAGNRVRIRDIREVVAQLRRTAGGHERDVDTDAGQGRAGRERVPAGRTG